MVDANIPDIALEPDKTVKKVNRNLPPLPGLFRNMFVQRQSAEASSSNTCQEVMEMIVRDTVPFYFLVPGAGQVPIGPFGRGGGPLHAEPDRRERGGSVRCRGRADTQICPGN